MRQEQSYCFNNSTLIKDSSSGSICQKYGSSDSMSQEQTFIDMRQCGKIKPFQRSKIIQEFQNSQRVQFSKILHQLLQEEQKIKYEGQQQFIAQKLQKSKLLYNSFLMSQSQINQNSLRFSQKSAMNANVLRDSSKLQGSQFQRIDISVIKNSNQIFQLQQKYSDAFDIQEILSNLDENKKKRELEQQVQRNQLQLQKLRFQLFKQCQDELFKRIRKYVKEEKLDKQKSLQFLHQMKIKLQAGMNHSLS